MRKAWMLLGLLLVPLSWLATQGSIEGKIATVRKRPMTPVKRLTVAMQRLDKENPFIPMLVHAIERHLQGVTDKSEIDRALEEALRRHPGVTREMLRQFVADYKQVPEKVRMRITPVQLKGLTPERKLEMTTFATTLRAIKVDKLIPPLKPQVPFNPHAPFDPLPFDLRVIAKLLPLTNPHIIRLEPDS